MNIKVAYSLFEGDYKELSNRLRSDKIIIKFLNEISEERLLEKITSGLKNNNENMVFIFAHTLKGISKNLNLHKLENISSEFTELFREPRKEVDKKIIDDVFNRLKIEYEKTVDIIQQIE